MARNDGSLIFDTKIDRKGFEDGVSKLGSMGTKAFGAVTKIVAGTATAVAGIGIASIKVGSTFSSAMSGVAATMGITVDEINQGSESFEMLKAAAKEAGATTKYSASESAEALNYLALAGYDAEKSVEALPKVLNLAAAGGLDLAYASDLVTDSMSALGMETDELEGFVDELAKTSQKSNTDVAQLGEAILNIGGTAKIMAGGTVELNTQLGILADNGIKGAEGGTALRNVLLSLSAPTDKQAKAMKELGVETYDANGNFRSTDDIFQDLNGTLGDMSKKERTEVLSELFNKVDLKAANALLAGSGERFGELSNEIANADGAAENMAETLNNNLKGKIGLLKSALEGLGIEIYESVDAPLMNVADAAVEMVGRLSDAFKKEGVAGLVSELGSILSDMVAEVAKATPKFLRVAVDMMKAFIKGIMDNKGELIDSAIEIITLLVDTFFEILPEMLELGIDLVLSLIDGMIDTIPDLMDGVMQLIDTIIDKIIDNLPEILEMGIEILLKLIEGLIKAIPRLIEMIPQIIGAIADTLLAHDWGGVAISLINMIIDGLLSMIDSLFTAGWELVKAIGRGIKNGFGAIFDLGVDIVKGLWQGMGSMKDWVVDKVVGLGKSIADGFKSFFGIKSPSTLMAEFGLNIVEGLALGIKDNKTKAEKAMYDMAQSIVKEYDRLGDAIITGLKNRYREEERVQLESLRKQTDEIRKESDKRIKEYNRERAAKLKALDIETSQAEKELQSQIDAINGKTNKENKAIREQSYQKALSEKRKAIDLARSKDEREKLEEELNQMILDKERERLLEQRQAQIESLRQEMDRVRDQASKKRVAIDEEYNRKIENENKKLESTLKYYDNEMEATKKHYAYLLREEELQAEARYLVLEENNDELIDLLEFYNPSWQNKGQSFGESLLLGLNSMKTPIQNEIDSILGMLDQADRDYASKMNGGTGKRYEDNAQNHNIIQAKKDWERFREQGDIEGMRAVEALADEMRRQGGTIGADVSLEDALRYSRSMQSNVAQSAGTMPRGQSSITNNNDNGIIQNVNIVNPEGTPSENARQLKKAGRELALGY